MTDWVKVPSSQVRLASGPPLPPGQDAARVRAGHVLAQSVNTCDPEPMISLFAESVEFDSQNLSGPISGKSEVTAYFRKLFDNIRASGRYAIAELGRIDAQSQTNPASSFGKPAPCARFGRLLSMTMASFLAFLATRYCRTPHRREVQASVRGSTRRRIASGRQSDYKLSRTSLRVLARRLSFVVLPATWRRQLPSLSRCLNDSSMHFPKAPTPSRFTIGGIRLTSRGRRSQRKWIIMTSLTRITPRSPSKELARYFVEHQRACLSMRLSCS